MAIAKSAGTTMGIKHLLRDGIVNDSDAKSVVQLQRDRHAEGGESVKKVCRSIQWIDDPSCCLISGTALFFRIDVNIWGVIRKKASQ